MEKENAYIFLDWNSAQICWIPEAKQCRQECQSSSQIDRRGLSSNLLDINDRYRLKSATYPPTEHLLVICLQTSQHVFHS